MNKFIKKYYRRHKNSGFTLIELLVVVLIIGILASVAVPQYEKAVWKSRSMQLLALVRSLAQAQNSFFLANGKYPARFSELDFDFDALSSVGSSACNLATKGSDSRRYGKNFELVINNDSYQTFMLSSVVFNSGPYKCGGFVFVHGNPQNSAVENALYCWEGAGDHRIKIPGTFCEKVMGATYDSLIGGVSGWRIYRLP